MSTHPTLSTVNPMNAELEEKRQAALASMKKRPLAISSQTNSRAPSPALTKSPGVEGASAMTDHNKLKSDLYDAIMDLRALGYSFEKIIELSGVNRNFLAQCYTEWKFPIPRVLEEPPPVSHRITSTSSYFFPRSTSATPLESRSNSTPPVGGFQRQLFNNKSSKIDDSIEKPEWLKNLVIDLEESSEEESESDLEEDEDQELKVHGIPDKADNEPVIQNDLTEESQGKPLNAQSDFDEEFASLSKKLDHQNNKKRRLSNIELGKLKKIKTELNFEIKKLSDQIRSKEDDISKVSLSINNLNSQLTEKDNQLSWLRKQLENLESESNVIRETVASKQEEIDSFASLKRSLSEKLVELDEHEKEEAKIADTEKRRLELKEKLMQQMKLKRKRKAEDASNLRELEQRKQQKDATVEDTNNNNDLVYAETIHKIPKVIN